MKAKVAALMLGIGAVGLLLAPAVGFVSSAEARCVTKRGKGWAWTKDMARFQAYEIVWQKYGGWPIPPTNFRKERYKCKPDGSGYTCLSWIDVCN